MGRVYVILKLRGLGDLLFIRGKAFHEQRKQSMRQNKHYLNGGFRQVAAVSHSAQSSRCLFKETEASAGNKECPGSTKTG